MKKIASTQMRARAQRLEQLARGLSREFDLWIQTEHRGTLDDADVRAYTVAIREAGKAVEAAAVVMARCATHALLNEAVAEDPRKSGLSKREG
jgi:hypothetical protein